MSNQETCKHTRRNFLSDLAIGSGLLLAGLQSRRRNGRIHRPGRSGGCHAAHRSGAGRYRQGPYHQHHRIQRPSSGAGDPLAGGRRGDGRPVQRHRLRRTGALARADHPGRRGRRRRGEEPGGPGPWPPALPAHAAALRRPLRAYPRDADVRPEPGHLHRTVRVCLHRAEEQPGAVRSGALSGHPRMGALLHDRKRGGGRSGARSQRSARRKTRNPTAGKSAISASPSMASAWGMASRCASKRDNASCSTS